MRPLRSVWSVPHRLGTLATHLLWMFIIQSGAETHKQKIIFNSKICEKEVPTKTGQHEQYLYDLNASKDFVLGDFCTGWPWFPHSLWQKKKKKQQHPDFPHYLSHSWCSFHCSPSLYVQHTGHIDSANRLALCNLLAPPPCFQGCSNGSQSFRIKKFQNKDAAFIDLTFGIYTCNK